MDVTKEDQYIFNLKMSIPLGLYQILKPSTTKLFGLNMYHLIVVFFGFSLCIASATCLIDLYHSTKNMTQFIYFIGCLQYFLFAFYKMLGILYNSKKIWICINDITNFNFMTYGHYNKNIFENWRKRCTLILCIYAVIIFINVGCWMSFPYVFGNTKIRLQNIHGSFFETRLNIFNIILFISDETYNRYFNIFYLMELVIMVNFAYFTVIFDILMFIGCLSLSCQLEIISNAIQSLGQKYSVDDNNLDMEKLISLDKDYDLSDDLKSIIKDHQMIMKNIEDYYNVFRPAILSQIFIASSLQVLGWLILSMSNYSEMNIGDLIFSLKLIVVLILITFQLFSTCVLFGIINEKKNSIIFALYSCNWTIMNLKCKKIVLFTMQMNNANQLKLKYTTTKVINLEMFTITMRACYSVFSMVVNYNKKL